MPAEDLVAEPDDLASAGDHRERLPCLMYRVVPCRPLPAAIVVDDIAFPHLVDL